MKIDNESVKIKDKSNDKKYYTQVPTIVWALSRNTYDLALWFAIKDIVGSECTGECILSTNDLAELSMMSVGKVSECRSYLISVGLLQGKCEKDPEYPQPVWHLTIPDVWEENIKLAKSLPGIKSKVKYKKDQAVNAKKELSPHESKELSPGEKGTTPGEKGYPPHEKGTPPGETIKNYKEHKEKREELENNEHTQNQSLKEKAIAWLDNRRLAIYEQYTGLQCPNTLTMQRSEIERWVGFCLQYGQKMTETCLINFLKSKNEYYRSRNGSSDIDKIVADFMILSKGVNDSKLRVDYKQNEKTFKQSKATSTWLA